MKNWRYFSTGMCDVLVEHLDGQACPIDVRDHVRQQTIRSLMERGCLEYSWSDGAANIKNSSGPPGWTRLTPKGRERLGKILASYCEALTRAAALRNETLASLVAQISREAIGAPPGRSTAPAALRCLEDAPQTEAVPAQT